MEPNDIAPLSDSEVDARLQRFFTWVDRSAVDPEADIPFKFSYHRGGVGGVKLVAKRALPDRTTMVRLPARMVLAFEVLCRRTGTGTVGGGRGEHDDEVPQEFCRLMGILRESASTRAQQECSSDTESFRAGFGQSVLSLFLVYVRWTDEARLPDAAKFFRPYVDILPRVPPSPLCTFSDDDLRLFPLASSIRNERATVEAQWRHLQQQAAAMAAGKNHSFAAVFPHDMVTLSRYMWAHCTVRSRMLKCYRTQTPCLFPVVDLAGYKSAPGLSFQTRLSQLQPLQQQRQQQQQQQADSAGTTATSRIEPRPEPPRGLVSEFALSMPLRKGTELRFALEEFSHPFIHRGIIDYDMVRVIASGRGGGGIVNHHCPVILLPRVGEPLYNPCLAHSLWENAVDPGSAAVDSADQQPLTCMRPDELKGIVAKFQRLRLYDSKCDVYALRTRHPEEPTAENLLRAVGFIGKLVRAQMERLSRAIDDIEAVVSLARQHHKQKQVHADADPESAGEGSEDDESSTDASSSSSSDNNFFEQQEQQQREADDEAEQESAFSQTASFLSAALSETSMCSASNVIRPSVSASATIRASAAHEKGIVVTGSSGACKIFQGNAKHALLILDWVQLEHHTVKLVYDALVKMRQELRSQLKKQYEDVI